MTLILAPRLAAARRDRTLQGIVCDGEGVRLGPCTLIKAERIEGRRFYRVRPAAEIALLLIAAYGTSFPANLAARMERLHSIAKWLNRGELGLAIMGALHLKLPPLDEEAHRRLSEAKGGFVDGDGARISPPLPAA